MKKFLTLAIVALAAILLSGCSSVKYYTPSQSIINTTVQLDHANFKVLGQVTGTSTTKYVFYIGVKNEKYPPVDAVAEMYRKAHLKDNQAIVNVSTIIRTKGGFFRTFVITETTGTIIEFTE